MSVWDEMGNFLGKVGGVYADIIEAKETDQPQLSASAGVTEPVTPPAPTATTQQPVVTVTTPDNQIISGVENKYLALGVGALVLLVMVMGGRR